jgi:hypothetical protein
MWARKVEVPLIAGQHGEGWVSTREAGIPVFAVQREEGGGGGGGMLVSFEAGLCLTKFVFSSLVCRASN